MNDMVERVAIALFCADGINPHDPFEWNTGMLNERGREMWRGLARVAIEAMREPTDAMTFVASNGEMGFSQDDVKIGWQLMINEALGKVDA